MVKPWHGGHKDYQCSYLERNRDRKLKGKVSRGHQSSKESEKRDGGRDGQMPAFVVLQPEHLSEAGQEADPEGAFESAVRPL